MKDVHNGFTTILYLNLNLFKNYNEQVFDEIAKLQNYNATRKRLRIHGERIGEKLHKNFQL